MTRILVIGATGNIGRHVAAQLPAAGVQVRALARNPETAHLPPDVEVLRGDLTLADTLEESLDGVDAVFLVWTAPQTAVVAAMERILAQAKRIVFLSAPHNIEHPFFQAAQPNPITALLSEIERLIATSSRQWTFLRPGMLASNALHWWAPQIRAGANIIRWPYAAAPTAPIDERDIAAVAIHALTGKGSHKAEYILTGPQSLTQTEQLEAIGSAIGRPLRMEEISPQQARSELFPGAPPFVLNMLLAAWAAAIGQPAFVTSTVEEVAGNPARTFNQWATDHAAAFRA